MTESQQKSNESGTSYAAGYGDGFRACLDMLECLKADHRKSCRIMIRVIRLDDDKKYLAIAEYVADRVKRTQAESGSHCEP